MRMSRVAALLILAGMGAAAPAQAASRCDFRHSHTVLSNDRARVFWVAGRGADKRVYFGCLRTRKPILLTTDTAPKASDETHTANTLFTLAGTWVGFLRSSSSDFGAGEFGQSVVVRSVSGAKRAIEQDVSRFGLKRLVLAPDGSVAWVLSAGEFREVDGIAASATRPTPLAVARGISSPSLTLAGGVVKFTLAGAARSVRLTAPAPPATGNGLGRQGLDGRFGDCGTLVPASPKPGVFTQATQMARAPGGGFVVAGTTSSNPGASQPDRDSFVVARFSPAGKFDAGFGRTGVVQVKVPRPAGGRDATLTGVAVQPDGKVIVAGYVELSDPSTTQAILMRFTAGGALDESFGSGGMAQDAIPAQASVRVEDVALTADGRILVAGQRDGRYFVARLTPAGAVDPGFAADGLLTDPGKEASELRALVVGGDGTIFAAGGTGQPLLLRLTPDGALASVSSDGPPAIAMLRSLERTADGGVVASGVGRNISGTAQLLLARYGADGKPEPGFDGDGFVLDPGISEPHDIAVAPDGALLVTASFFLNPGGYSGNGLVRYSPTGARDASFGFRGVLGGTSSFGLDDFDLLVDTNGTALAAQDNGGAFAVSRFAVSGSALGATSGRSSVCAMATAVQIGPMVKARKIDVSLRLRAPGKLRVDAVVRIGGKSIPAGTVTVFRPYTEGAVASIPLTKPALAALRGAKTAKLILSAGAPGKARTAYTATLTR
ncbi:MAG: hypothetical protein JWM73_359 [Solirubrobacterales bacterium]|nr:hypothetical protein [Solirubrobacterales bacterium]